MFRAAGADDPDIRLDPSPEDVDSIRLRSLFRYWDALPRGTRLPLTRAIDAVEIGPALGIVMLLETGPDPYEFRYRLYGSEIALVSNLEMTGKTTGEIPAPEIRPFFQATYAAAVRSGAPILCHHRPPPAYGMTCWSRLILPCEDGSGRIDRLLVGNEPAFPKLVGRTPWPYA
ncbi:PAS domain-containing protein [Thalassobaculum sp. OXR-137]|uniref:PAS domain-containing protein n=1 Tax=Thalassobaculum sp. OXR-137 TaxID=3100173 RepID=UPI002AC98A8B|nr:PAS domain-containing protein [Thalassobaculum sp. OXR-137]WPZ36985.1 PAS domain-containing protein [Thalassobaculum sp. OXR-137]